jgi:hypothetical protein
MLVTVGVSLRAGVYVLGRTMELLAITNLLEIVRRFRVPRDLNVPHPQEPVCRFRVMPKMHALLEAHAFRVKSHARLLLARNLTVLKTVVPPSSVWRAKTVTLLQGNALQLVRRVSCTIRVEVPVHQPVKIVIPRCALPTVWLAASVKKVSF